MTRAHLASILSILTATLLIPACGGDIDGAGAAGGASTSTGTTTTGGSGGSTPDAGPIDKAEHCAPAFGQELTAAFGRLDGTVLAVVQPKDTQCALPNDDHVVLQVLMNNAAYRMVINIQSSYGDPDVRYQALAHTMPAPAWSEGWHPGLALDYVADFGVHTSAGFTPHPLAELSQVITDAIGLGQKVSVYAESSGGDSAHKIHRNTGKTDGAIVLDPDSASPTVLLFHFANQSF